MTAPKWHEGRMDALDTESTGTNPLEARIVTAAIVHHNPGTRPRVMQWIIDPGVDIPTEASDVHGWTRDRLDDYLQGAEAVRLTHEGRKIPLERDVALFELAGHVGLAIGLDVPLVVCNAPYDFTLLETELARNDVDTLASRPKGIRGIVDPQVIEKAFDPYRKVKGGCRGGKYKCGGCGVEDKKLTSLCTHYGVVHGGAHDAAADAVAALRLSVKLAAAWPEVARWKLSTLHEHQIGWRKSQADGLRDYFDKNGIEHDGVDPGWPVYESMGVTS